MFEFNYLSLLCNMNTLWNIDDTWYKCTTGCDQILRTRTTNLAGLEGDGGMGWGGRGGGRGGGDICFF